MLDAILEMQSMPAFHDVSQRLTNQEARSVLYSEVARSGLVCSTEDRLSEEDIQEIVSNEGQILKFLSETGEHPKEAKLVTRLQVVGACNYGASKFINKFLRRACV